MENAGLSFSSMGKLLLEHFIRTQYPGFYVVRRIPSAARVKGSLDRTRGQ